MSKLAKVAALSLFLLWTYGLLSISSVNAREVSSEPLIIAITNSWHPYSYTSETGEARGVLVNFWQEYSELLARRTNIQPKPRRRLNGAGSNFLLCPACSATVSYARTFSFLMSLRLLVHLHYEHPLLGHN